MLIRESSISKKLLLYFFSNKNDERYGRELAIILKVDPKNLHTKIKEFIREGLLASRRSGNREYYRLNPYFPLLKEYEKIIQKEFGLEPSLKKLLSGLKGIKEAYIFGSYARSDQDSKSDVDVLVIGTHKAIDAQKTILDLQKKLGREINIIDMTPQEFNRKKNAKDPLINDILKKPKIKII